MSAFEAGLLWYCAISLAGLATYPLLYLATERLPDRGMSIVRPAGLALVILPLWVIGNISGIPFNSWTIAAAAFLLAAPGWWYGHAHSDLMAFVSRNLRTLLSFEIATVTLFAGYLVFRGFNPDIADTEKPMELAFLNSAIHAGEIPVPDPWFAGEPINYYYFGYLAMAAVSVVARIPGEVAFNLSLATTFALATVAGGGLAYNLNALISGYRRLQNAFAAVLGGFLLTIAGNIHGAISFFRNPDETISAGWWQGIGWSSSRVIEDSGFDDGSARNVITEFPAFSMILGDLHPHVITYPWLIMSFALLVNMHQTLIEPAHWSRMIVPGAAIGLAIGILYGSNTWDVPIIVATLGMITLSTFRRIDWPKLGALAAATALATTVAIVPFAMRYVSPAGGVDSPESGILNEVPGIGYIANSIGYVAWNRSTTAELLTHWGGQLLLIAVLLGAIAWRAELWNKKSSRYLGAGFALLLIVAILTDTPALAIFGGPAAVFLYLAFLQETNPPQRVISAFLGVALVVLVAIEYVYIRDPFGDRMNTVFKFSFQVWALLAISLAAAIPAVICRICSVRGSIQTGMVLVAASISLILMSFYSPVSAYRWSDGFEQWRGLDGTQRVRSSHPGEGAAINWLRDNRQDVEVILEAAGCGYGTESGLPHSRVSMATGLPTVIGWVGHQHQWRRGQPERLEEIGDRIEHVRSMYEEPSDSGELFQRYGVTHVYVGTHEVQGYERCESGGPYDIPDGSVLEQLGWEIAFERGPVIIFGLPGSDSRN